MSAHCRECGKSHERAGQYCSEACSLLHQCAYCGFRPAHADEAIENLGHIKSKDALFRFYGLPPICHPCIEHALGALMKLAGPRK